MELVFGFITVVALGFAIYQTIQAKKVNEKLEQTREQIKELEDGLLLSNYKLKKAYDFYEDGHFKNSLEVFKKYAKESEDSSEFYTAVKDIFWKETRKIYSKHMGSGCTPSILVMIIICKNADIESTYPDFLIDLCNLCFNTTEKDMSSFLVPMYLNRLEFDNAMENLENFKAQYEGKLANETFRKFITDYSKFRKSKT